MAGGDELMHADMRVLARLLVYGITLVQSCGARASIADHLLNALREIEDGAFEAPDASDVAR